ETGIQGPDTVCINSTVLYTSLSDTAYKRDLWSFSDTSNVIDTIIRASIIKHFDKAGVHSIFLKPQYLNALNNTCLDSARKDVFVIGVKSLFSIDPVSQAPVFKFINEAEPFSATMDWDFGQHGANSNELLPQHDFGPDTGPFHVCLVASLPPGCADTFCMPVVSGFLSAFTLPNVFTPGE